MLTPDIFATKPSRPYAHLTLASSSNGIHADIEALRQYVSVRNCKHYAGQSLYRAGQPFQVLYLVQAGSYKICKLADGASKQVTGCMGGDLVGMESIGLKTYSSDATALEDSEAWELPYPSVLRACLRIPTLQSCLTSALNKGIRSDRSWMLRLGTLAAERRVAAFLIDATTRHDRLGRDAEHLMLRMSHIKMASFLALQYELVSLALSRLHDMNYIDVQRRKVRVLDIDCLRSFAGAGPW